MTLLEPSAPTVFDLRVQARVVRTRAAHGATRKDAYRISLEIDTGVHRAKRTLHAATCAELAETAAWLIALTVDPELSPPPTESEEDQVAQNPPEGARAGNPAKDKAAVASVPLPASDARANEEAAEAKAARSTQPKPQHSGARAAADPPRVSARSKADSVSRQHAFHAGASAGMVSGQGPFVQAALGAFAGYGFDFSYTQARVAGSLPRSVDVSPMGSARIWTLALEITECALFGKSVRAGPCLLASLLRSAAHLEGLTSARDRAYLWGSAGAGLQVFWRVTRRFELSLAGAANIPLSSRPRFVVEGTGAGAQPWSAAARAWSADLRLGIGVVLP